MNCYTSVYGRLKRNPYQGKRLTEFGNMLAFASVSVSLNVTKQQTVKQQHFDVVAFGEQTDELLKLKAGDWCRYPANCYCGRSMVNSICR